MTNLILHAGASATTANAVRQVATPAATDTHFPIPHVDLIDVALNIARQDFGLDIVNQSHGMTQEGARYFGLFELGADTLDYAPVIGLRNAHDKSFSAGLVIGSSVFVCDNMAFSGEIRLARKHTRNINRDLPVLVHRAFAKLGRMQQRMDLRIAAYKDATFSAADRDHVLMESARNGALAWSGLGKVQAEFDKPAHSPEEFGVEQDSAWYLFNCCTEIMKTRSRNGVDPRWTQFLHRVFDHAVDLGDDEDDELTVEGEFEVLAEAA